MSRDDAHRFIIAYDIPDDRRRTRLAKLLEGHGDRLQYSVFVVDSRPAKLERLRQEIKNKISVKEDSVLICDIGLVPDESERSRFSFIGVDRPITPQEALIV